MRFHTILIVDDYEPFRRLTRLALSARTDLQVVGEASDGADALEKAQELQPDLVLMDLGLPKLNGMDATRRLRTLVAHARIIIISQESSGDVVQESLRSGAAGYVHKAYVHSDLLPAIEVVLNGRQFVSSNLEDWETIESAAGHVPHGHEILVCSYERVLLEGFTRFIGNALRSGNSAVVIATKSHLDLLYQALRGEGIDVEGAIQQEAYILVDVADMPSTFMANGWPELTRRIETAYKAAKAAHPRVALCGECAGRLWAEGRVDAAIRLEQLCDDMTKTGRVDILCAYPLGGGRNEEQEDAFQAICAEHSAVHSR